MSELLVQGPLGVGRSWRLFQKEARVLTGPQWGRAGAGSRGWSQITLSLRSHASQLYFIWLPGEPWKEFEQRRDKVKIRKLPLNNKWPLRLGAGSPGRLWGGEERCQGQGPELWLGNWEKMGSPWDGETKEELITIYPPTPPPTGHLRSKDEASG